MKPLTQFPSTSRGFRRHMNLVTMLVVHDPGQTIVRVGVDVRQRQGFTAMSVTEQKSRLDLPPHLARSIEHLPLGTACPAVVDQGAEIMERLEAKGQSCRGPRLFTVELILDATGVGLPIGDMLRRWCSSTAPTRSTSSRRASSPRSRAGSWPECRLCSSPTAFTFHARSRPASWRRSFMITGSRSTRMRPPASTPRVASTMIW